SLQPWRALYARRRARTRQLPHLRQQHHEQKVLVRYRLQLRRHLPLARCAHNDSPRRALQLLAVSLWLLACAVCSCPRSGQEKVAPRRKPGDERREATPARFSGRKSGRKYFALMTTNLIAHGMDGTLVSPDWPPLTLTELRPLFAQFPALGEPIRIESVSPRPFSAASVIAACNGHDLEQRIFVKRHHRTVRDREGLLEEHRFLAHLLSRGAPVPRVLRSASAETAISLGDSTYELHEIPAGIDLYEDAISWIPFRAAAHAHSAGQALARLHLAAQGFAAPPRAVRPLVASFTIFAAANPAAEMQRYLAARPSL